LWIAKGLRIAFSLLQIPKDTPVMTGFRRFAALVCAAAYLSGGVEVLPEVVAFGAWLEGSHSIGLALGADQVTVVLSHDQAGSHSSSGANPVHHHGPVARVICLMATSQTRLDHVAGFSPTQLSENAQSLAKLTPKRFFCNSVPILPREAEPCASVQLAAEIRSPLRLFDSLGLLQSTVLII
jgi:hypothetical protein